MWETRIELMFDDNIDEIKRVCEDIRSKDSSFDFKIVKSKSLRYDYTLIVYSPDKDTAHRRGVWLINRVAALRGKHYSVFFGQTTEK